MNYLNAFRPLIVTAAGQHVSFIFGLPPFIDGSIRREPDLESPFPSITALCRGNLFAPRLRPGDRVIYITVKRPYPPVAQPHWRLVALLHVVELFQSHSEGAAWYTDRELAPPNNCLVPGNPPKPVEQSSLPSRDPRAWELGYQLRARKTAVFIICEPTFIELYNPPVIIENAMVTALGRIPGLQNPPSLSDDEYERLASFALTREDV
jgi:hypothetical protein